MNKMTKDQLIEQLNIIVDERQEMRKELAGMRSIYTEQKQELETYAGLINRQETKLSSVKQALITVGALNFPREELSPVDVAYGSYEITSTLDAEHDESEVMLLRFLKHLMKLCEEG